MSIKQSKEDERHERLRWCETCQRNVEPTWRRMGLKCPVCSTDFPLLVLDYSKNNDKENITNKNSELSVLYASERSKKVVGNEY